MPEDPLSVDQFVIDQIDTVPHLEALLLLWRSAPEPKSIAQLACLLYVPANQAAGIADDLVRRGLIARAPGGHLFYDLRDESHNRLLGALEATYRLELIRISGIIHSKASPGIRAFANAFRFRKEKS
jgi:hypothetical protein